MIKLKNNYFNKINCLITLSDILLPGLMRCIPGLIVYPPLSLRCLTLFSRKTGTVRTSQKLIWRTLTNAGNAYQYTGLDGIHTTAIGTWSAAISVLCLSKALLISWIDRVLTWGYFKIIVKYLFSIIFFLDYWLLFGQYFQLFDGQHRSHSSLVLNRFGLPSHPP